MNGSPSSSHLQVAPERSRLMKRVRREHTAPELLVRGFLHANGLRFRLHCVDLPGRPDLVFSRRHTVVFVHGCFWHGHHCRHGAARAKTNAAYWSAKRADNRARDRRQQNALRRAGWFVEVIWECEIANATPLVRLALKLLSR